MEFCPGQRWISESQPEKGLGLILKNNNETVTVMFPAVDETLTYASKSAPLRRVIFDTGDTIELQDGSTLIVDKATESEGIITYSADDVSAKSENFVFVELKCNFTLEIGPCLCLATIASAIL